MTVSPTARLSRWRAAAAGPAAPRPGCWAGCGLAGRARSSGMASTGRVLAVGESVILTTPPFPSPLKHLQKGEGGEAE